MNQLGTNNRLAVVLNANARSVTQQSVEMVRAAINLRPKRDEKLYVSTSLEDARRISHELMEKKFDVILSGGGDGTFCHCVTDIIGRGFSAMRHPRAFGVLRLGTGNALADTLGVGFSRTPEELRQELDHAKDPRSRRMLTLVSTEGRIAPFAGAGLDAMIISDYDRVKSELDASPIKKEHRGKLEYGLAIATKSIWRVAFSSMPKVTITNESDKSTGAVEIGPRANEIRRFSKGDVIFEGPASMAAVSTIKHYGMGLRMFPQVDPQDRVFQLRVVSMRAYQMLAHLPSFLLGDMVHSNMRDFFCEKISMRFNRKVPFQVGGDLIGERESVEMETAIITAIVGRKSWDPYG